MDTIEFRIKERMSKEIKGLNFFKSVDIKNPKRNEYSETKRELRFFQVLFGTKMDNEDENYIRIKEYIDRTENQYPETGGFEELFDEYDVEKDKDLTLQEYIVRIFSKYPGAQAQIFTTTFVNGITYDFKARERQLKDSIPYLANENILLIHDSTFFANCSKGFLITENKIVDLKSKQCIDLADIIDLVITKNSIDVLGKSNTLLSMSFGNSVIRLFLESIVKCYTAYKGKILREETNKLNAEIERERKISELTVNSAEDCFVKGIENAVLNNVVDAEFYFVAMERNADTNELKILSYLGQGICCLDNNEKVSDFINKAMELKTDIGDKYISLFERILKYTNDTKKGLLNVIIQAGNLEAFNYFIQFIDDVNMNFGNATMLDISVYSRKLNRAKVNAYKEIEEILIEKGCERKWDVEYNRPYMQISNIQEIIKQSIFKCVEKSNNEIKVGEDLRRAIPDKCQKAAVNLGIKYENPVYMIYDNTTFKSLKSGFAICSDGIYIASDIGEHLYIPWETILNVQIVVNGGFIFFEGAKLAVNSQNAMCFYKLFDDISYEIKEYGSGAKAVAENVVEESVTEKVIEEVSIIEETVKEMVEEESLIEEVQVEELEIASVEEQDKIETEKIELEVEEAKVEETMVEEQLEKTVVEEPKVASGTICKNCGKELSSIAKFCNRCGTKVEISEIKIEPIIEVAKSLEGICPNCNTINSEKAKFCKRCGTKLKD